MHINPEPLQKKFEETVRVPISETFNSSREVYTAIQKAQNIEFRKTPVIKNEPVMSTGEGHDVLMPDLDRKPSKDIVAYEFTLRVPQEQKADLVMEICDHCKQSFANEKKP